MKRKERRAEKEKWLLENPLWPQAKRMVASARNRAREKGLPFDLKATDIYPLPTHCPVLGIEMMPHDNRGFQKNAYSLDRIIPARGYVKGNVAVISLAANMAKSCASLKELRKVADWLESVYPDDAWLDE